MIQMCFHKKPTILIADDEITNIDILVDNFDDNYDIIVATDGYEVLDITREDKPDLILLDIIMPKINGYEICELLKNDKLTRDIPIVFISGLTDIDNKMKAFDIGGSDYITKPYNFNELKARVDLHLELHMIKSFLGQQNMQLENLVKQRTKEIEKTRAVTVKSLGTLAETRDPETGAHIKRTQEFVILIANFLKKHKKYKNYLTDEVIQIMYESAPLHDIGKVGIPDHILLKPGKLTQEEFDIMKEHPVIGAKSFEMDNQYLSHDKFLTIAHDIINYHHEKWNGTGYPKGLKKEQIPLSARIMALADVYDALTSKRVYKPSFTHEKARAIILNDRGQHFDPDIVDAFLVLEDKFVEITKNFQDE